MFKSATAEWYIVY